MAAFFRNLLLSLLILVVASSSTSAAPTLNEEYDYYNIQGPTWKDLRDQMKDRGVKDRDGITRYGFNNWHVSWRFQYNSMGGRCSIASVKTTVKIKYTLPKWVNQSDAPVEMREEWDKYMAALIKHERAHTDIALQAAREIELAIAGTGPRRNCQELQTDANAIGHRIVDDCKKRQVKYDARTDHGKLEGARLR